jgi:hypothetical protein
MNSGLSRRSITKADKVAGMRGLNQEFFIMMKLHS